MPPGTAPAHNRAYPASYALGISSLFDLIRRLNNDPLLRSTCGFTNYLPSYPTFWRVFDQVAGMPERIDECCQVLLEQLRELLPDLGQEVAVDSTTIKAYANGNRTNSVRNPGAPADPDASWTKKHSAQDPSHEGWLFGYKVHIVADANHDIPLQMTVTSASRNDNPLLEPLLSGLEAWCQWFRLANRTIVIADRGYDSQHNNVFVHRSGGIPVIHKRRPPGGKLHDGIYTTDGVPTCLGQVEMEYIRTDPDTGHHLYRCPAGGCARRQTVLGYAAGGDEAREGPERDVRLFGGRIRRGSPEWDTACHKRWSVERVFSRRKYPGRLERHKYFGLRRVSAHTRLQMLLSLAERLAQVKAAAAAV